MKTKTFNRQTAKFLAVVGENMPEIPSSLMQEWIEHPKDLQKVLWTALCPLKTVPVFKRWRTVKIGTYKSVERLANTLTANGFRISDGAATILERMTLAPIETEIELVQVTAHELGFNQPTRRDALYARAKELGLGIVPAEAGPQLRLRYADQPMGNWMLMAMPPVACSDGPPLLLRVAHDENGLWLDILYDLPEFEWNPRYRWVFARHNQD